MWGVFTRALLRRAPYITLPIAFVVGVIGYNVEGLLSNRYTPHNSKPIQDQRLERVEENLLNDPTNVERLKYKENVFQKNVSPSLQDKS